MDKKELTKEEKTIKREMLLIGIIAIIIPILLFVITFTGADAVTYKSSLTFNEAVTGTSFFGMILGFISIPFTFITVIGQYKKNTLMLFSGSLFLAVFCLFVIMKLSSIPWLILMIFIAVVLIVLNIDVLALETKINEKEK